MMGRPRALAAFLATLLVTAPALAQPQPSEKDKEKAGELVKKAIAKSQAGDHQAAIDLYLESYGVIATPILLSNIGTEYQTIQKPVEALKYFCMYLEKDPTGPVASYATAQAKVVQEGLGNPVDDANVCAPKKVEPPPPPPPDPNPPPPPPPVDTGAGRNMKLAGIGVGAAGVVSLGVGIVFGIKAKSISDDISDHCMGMTPCPEWPSDIKEMEADGQRYENLQIVGLILGGSLVVVGGLVYMVGRGKEKRASESSVQVAPNVAPGSVGVTISGGF